MSGLRSKNRVTTKMDSSTSHVGDNPSHSCLHGKRQISLEREETVKSIDPQLTRYAKGDFSKAAREL